MAMYKVLPAVAGTLLEYYEYGAYLALTNEITANLFAGASHDWTWAMFAVGQASRPFGALLFGLLSDSIGRRPAILICTMGMTICTACIGAIPTGYCAGPSGNTIGIVLLVILRLCQGLFASGELISVLSFNMEHVNSAQVGFFVALPLAANQCGALTASAIAAIMESSLSQHDLLLWGWRIPFLLALPISIPIIIAQLLYLEEPERVGPRESTVDILRSIPRKYKWHLLAAFCLCCLQPAFQYGNLNYFKYYLTDHGLVPVATAGWGAATAVGLTVPALLAAGLLSDRIGSYSAAVRCAIAMGILIYPTWCLLVAPLADSSLHVYLASGLLGLLFCEVVPFILLAFSLFPIEVRATLMGLGYNCAHVVFGASAPFINQGIINALLDSSSSPSWLVYTTPSIVTFAGLAFSTCGLLLFRRLLSGWSSKRPSSSPDDLGTVLYPVAYTAILSLFLDLAATTVIVPLLPTYNLTAVETTFVFLLKPLAETISNLFLLGPSVADYFGPKRPAVIGLVLILLGTFLLSVSDVRVLLIARAVGGLGASMVVPSMFKLVNATYSREHGARDRVVSMALAGDALGGVVGPIIGSGFFNIVHAAGASMALSRMAPILVVASICGACIVFVFCCPDRHTDSERVLSLVAIFSQRGISAVAIAAFAFGATSFHIGALESTTPLLLIGYGVADSGYVWALVGMGFSITAPLSLRLMRAFRAPPVCYDNFVARETHGVHDKAQSLLSDVETPSRGWLSTSFCDCAARASPTSTSKLTSDVSWPLRHAWVSVVLGALLLVGYAVGLLFVVAGVHPESFLVDSSPPASFIIEVCFTMLILGFALGFVYVPLNTFTQDLTIRLLDESALARTIGFLQGAKNLGLIVGYAVGPAFVHMLPSDLCAPSGRYATLCQQDGSQGSEDTGERFKSLTLLLSCVGGAVAIAAIGLRVVSDLYASREANRLLPPLQVRT